MRRSVILVLMLALPGLAVSADPPEVAEALAAIRAVKPQGDGNDTAAKAWKTLTAAGSKAFLPTLSAFDGTSSTTGNWLRTAADAIAETESAAKRKLDEAALTAFVTDARRHPDAREIAFTWLSKQNETAATALLPTFLNDTSLVLRRNAIETLFAKQTTRDATPDVAELTKLFNAARDKDQVEVIAKKLEELKALADVTRHFGYITEWSVVGPFSNKLGTGYGTVHAPEKSVDLTAKYPATSGDTKIGWVYAQSDQKYGAIDLNAALGKHMDVVGYAYTVIRSDIERPAELRVASQNAIRIIVNGQELLAREEYHHGQSMDQHVAKFTLKSGANTVLLKVCQNNQKDSWAQVWGFSARLCDATGGKLAVKQVVSKDGSDAVVELGARKPAAKKEDKK